MRCLVLVVWLTGPVVAGAQVAPVTIPKGAVRLELDGAFAAFDERFHNGTRESYAADLSSPALGSDRIPAAAARDAGIARITGNAGYHLNLGRLATDAEADVAAAVVGVSLGVTSRLTIFGRLPLVRNRVQYSLTLDSATADAGLVPPTEQQAAFFTQFETALNTLNTRIASGAYDGDAARKARAQATLASGTSLHDDLIAILEAPASDAPFAPTVTSAAGTAVAGAVTTLQNTLSTDLGVSGFTLGPTLPTQRLSEEEFESFLSASDGLAYRPGQAEVQFRGDAEAGAAYTLVDDWDQGKRRGGFRTALSALVRFPTGLRERPDRPLDLGTGDGQTDVEVSLVTDVGTGRWGARLTGTYVRQLEANIVQRVTRPSEPLVGPSRLAVVRWNPGDVVAVGVRPFYRLANTLAIQVAVDHWRHGEDEVSYATPNDEIPGVDANVLAAESKASATAVGIGITYANLAGLRIGGKGLPVDASWIYERVVSSGEGRVPAVQRVRASLRLYLRPFK